MKNNEKNLDYFNNSFNEEIFLNIVERSYLPTFTLLNNLLAKHENFKISFSISGTWLSQCEKYSPTLLTLIKEVIGKSNVELLCETSHHTLASLFDIGEFRAQVMEHRSRLEKLFGKRISTFRNTELIYSNAIGKIVRELGFSACLMEGWERVLTKNFDVQKIFSHPSEALVLLPRDYLRSDDISFRFSNKGAKFWPLTAEKYLKLLRETESTETKFSGIFMDFETFGEHQKAATGIFTFFADLVASCLNSEDIYFSLPNEAISKVKSPVPLSIEAPLSWADSERDVSAWLGNDLQVTAANFIYSLKEQVYGYKARDLNEQAAVVETWRRLQTSDHFYYMADKCSNDGDVHNYFSCYSSPLEAFLEYQNIVNDFSERLTQ